MDAVLICCQEGVDKVVDVVTAYSDLSHAALYRSVFASHLLGNARKPSEDPGYFIGLANPHVSFLVDGEEVVDAVAQLCFC
jgi:hypothetical protein